MGIRSYQRPKIFIWSAHALLVCSLTHANKLHDMIRSHDVDRACAIIKKQEPKTLNKIINGFAAIHLAAFYGLIKVVEQLVESGADIALETPSNESALSIAFKQGHDDVVEFLFKKGGNLFCQKASQQRELMKNNDETEFLNDQKIRDLLLSEDSREFFVFVYPLIMKKESVFEKLNHLQNNDEDFIFNVKKDAIYIENFVCQKKGNIATSKNEALITEEFLSIQDRFSSQKLFFDSLISDLLHGFANEEFPYGCRSKSEFMHLGQLLNQINASKKLRRKLWTAWRKEDVEYFEEKNDKRRPKNLKSIVREAKLFWAKHKAEDLAHLLTERDSRLFQSITLESLLVWINDNKQSDSVNEFFYTSDATINFFAFLIVSAGDHDLRVRRVRKLFNLGDQFLQQNNFLGVMLIAFTFNKPAVKNLIDWNEEQLPREKWLMFREFINPINNFKTYYSALHAVPTDEPCLPDLALLLRNLNGGDDLKINGISPAWLNRVGIALKAFNDLKKQSYGYKKEQTHTPFSDLPLIPDEIINEWSFAENPIDAKERSAPKLCDLKAWSCTMLMSTLFESNLYDAALKLFKAYIWDGNDLDSYLGEAGTLKEKYAKLGKLNIDANSARIIISVQQKKEPLQRSCTVQFRRQ